ncbi:type II toxin-antitoxin system RelE/ParE family toxin [Candidatus Sumerlaeota bacterium]|nr:type II toxin-antitoxin system RelE/ParE family toxin [Candidatus Sumerlaeota bacterium]
MRYKITFVPSANNDLDYFRAHEKKIIVEGIVRFLEKDANIESIKRKSLRPNEIGPWELRLGDFRIFYEIYDNERVRILAIGYKKHNDLFIRGKKVEI